VDNWCRLQSQTGLARTPPGAVARSAGQSRAGATAGLRAAARVRRLRGPDRTARSPEESGGEEREDEVGPLGEEFLGRQ